MSVTPHRLFTVKTGALLTTMNTAHALRMAGVSFFIQPTNGIAKGCECGECNEFMLTTDEKGIAALEAQAGCKIPPELYVLADVEGRIPFERRRVMAEPRYVQ